MADVLTPKPYILEYNLVAEPRGFVWAKVRPLEPADFDISVWTGTKWDGNDEPPCRVIYRCRLTLRSEVREEIRRIKPLFERLFNKKNNHYSWRWSSDSSETDVNGLLVDVHEPVKYQGAGTQEAKYKRWQKADNALAERVGKDGLEIIGHKIIDANIEIFEFIERQRADYIRDTLGWATRVDGYNIEEVDKLADNAALLAELPVLAAKIEGIERAIHDRRVAVIQKNWGEKDDCGYPADVLEAVRGKLRESNAIKPLHVRVMWPVM